MTERRLESAGPWTDHAALAVWTLLAVLYRGYGFGVGDQNLYLPFVMKWAHPGLFPGDYLLGLNYARESVTWVALSWASRIVDLRILACLAYAVTSYLTLWAILRLAQTWWGNRLSGWTAVFLWTPVYELPGSGMSTVDPYFTGRGLAYALCFFALREVLRERPAATVLLLCAAALVHSVSVLPFAGAIALWYLLEARWGALAALASSLTGVGLGLLAVASRGGGHDLWARYDPEWLAIASRGASCLFPTSWGSPIWGHLGLYAALSLALLALGSSRRGTVPHLRMGWSLVIVALALWGVSWLGTQAGLVLVVQLSLMRSCLLLILLLALTLAGWSASLLERGGWAPVLSASIVLAGWMTDHPLLQAIAFIVGASAVAIPWNGPAAEGLRRRGILTTRTAFLALVALSAALYAMHFYLGRTLPWTAPGPFALLQAGGVAALLASGWMLARSAGERYRAAILAMSFLLGVVIQPRPFAVQSLGPLPVLGWPLRPASTHTFARRMGAPAPRVRERLGRAVRELVPEGATVIVPAGWDSFRVATGRSSFVTLEDMIPAEFSRAFAAEWQSRMEAFYGRDFLAQVETLVGSPPLDEEAVAGLARRMPSLRIGYIVSTARYSFPALVQEGGWTLYRIPAPPAEELTRGR